MNINNRKETAKILNEWKEFLSEDKTIEIINEDKKIETIGDLKKLLDPKKKYKSAALSTLKDTLIGMGLDAIPMGNTAKTAGGALFSFFQACSDVEDGNREKLGPLKGLDFDDDFKDFINSDIMKELLKDMVKEMDDNQKLSDIDINSLLINKIKRDHNTQISK